jgi:hypothetical protein
MSERSGHIQWGDWVFDYDVVDAEALSLLRGSFRGRTVFYKLSLPVIRVKYVQDEDFRHNPLFGNGCGPYNDQITWDPEDFGENLNPIAGPHHLVRIGGECGGRYVCIKSWTSGGTNWLELGVYARIGAYHIYQAWYLNNNGVIAPRVFSKGLSCNLDHWHHPYWRFDIDLDGAGNQRVNVLDGNTWIGFVNDEGRFANSSVGGNAARYNVENLRTGAKCWIFPPAVNEEHGVVGPTAFSNLDAYVRRYRADEDRPWPHPPQQEIGFAVHENPDGGDIVFWQVSHLFHRAAEGKDHWHEVGPTLVFELPGSVVPETPASFRRIRVQGNIHVKDYNLIGSDNWGYFAFDETVIVNPSSPHAEFTVSRGPVDDVTAVLRMRFDRNGDNSVSVNFDAQLFDEDDLVSSVASHFNIPRDGSVSWGGLHMIDFHVGDPDTGDMDWVATNSQV